MFKFFKKKPEGAEHNIGFLLSKYAAHQTVLGHLSRAESLAKLGRNTEASAASVEARVAAQWYAKENPLDAQAQLLYAVYLLDSKNIAEALTFLPALLERTNLNLSQDERNQVAAQLHALRRQQPVEANSSEKKHGFTQVYACHSCGRLHNFASLPCPHCGWLPQTLEETAAAIVLSTHQITIPVLLSVSRDISGGRPAAQAVGNLQEIATKFLNDPGHRDMVERVFALIGEDSAKEEHRIEPLRACVACGTRIMYSQSASCQSCNETLDMPDIVRLLVCVDNLLWLLEQRIEPSEIPEFAEFVCVLVALENDILRKQSEPNAIQRSYALDMLRKVKGLWDINQGALVNFNADDSLSVSLIQDRAREDSKPFAIFIHRELSDFVQYMKAGVPH